MDLSQTPLPYFFDIQGRKSHWVLRENKRLGDESAGKNVYCTILVDFDFGLIPGTVFFLFLFFFRIGKVVTASFESCFKSNRLSVCFEFITPH